MNYKNDDLGFSFELPEDWKRDEHNLVLTFYGPNGGLGQSCELIQFQFGGILPKYLSPENREAFLAETGAKVFRGKLGDETNVVVLKKQTNSEISAVRDGIQYTISHANDPVTLKAVDRLCQTSQFPSPEQASAALVRWSDPTIQAIQEMLHADSASEARNELTHASVPSKQIAPGITMHDLEDVEMECPNVLVALQKGENASGDSPRKILLKRLDQEVASKSAAENELVAMGDEAIDDLLQSIAEINGRMNGSIHFPHLDPLREMTCLENRLRVIARIRSPKTLKALFDALTDSALAVETYTQKRDTAREQGQFVTSIIADEHIKSAKSLNKVAIKALTAYGAQVVPHARRYMSTSPSAVSKALRKVISILERKWWQFW